MKQNITLFVGDNAVGKTRKLKKIIKDCLNNEIEVVNNVVGYSTVESIDIDNEKLELIRRSNNKLYNQLNNHELNLNTRQINHIKKLFEIICSKGKVLVLDELDATLRTRDIVYIARAISSVRSLWDEIFVTGHHLNITMLFVDFNSEMEEEAYTPNIHLIGDNIEDIPITEEQANEYLDAI